MRSGVALNARSISGINAFNAAVASGNIRLARYLIGKKITLTPDDIRKIPDIYTLKSELAPRLAQLHKKLPVEVKDKPVSVDKKIATAEKLPVRKELTKEQPVKPKKIERKATAGFLAQAEAEIQKCKQLKNLRIDRKKSIDAAFNQKFRRRLEVYIQTAPAGRVPLAEEKIYIDQVISTLKGGSADSDMVVGRDQRPLLQVVLDGSLPPRRKLFGALLDSGADPDSAQLPDDRKMRMKMLEAGRSKFAPGEFVRVLSGYEPDWDSALIMLLRGAEPAEKDPVTGDNAFHRAAGLGNIEFLKQLVASGRQGWDVKNLAGHTPFQLAVISGKGETAHLLKKSFPESSASGAMYNIGALFRAIEKDDPGETAYRLMLDSDPYKVNALRLNALQYAAKIGSFKAARVLLEHRVSPDKYTGDSPLKLAVWNADSELVCLLVAHGADPDIEVVDIFGRKSLLFTEIFRRFAAEPEKMYQCFEALIKNKWDPHIKTPDGDTPLVWMEKWNAGTADVRELLRSGKPETNELP